MRVAVIGCGIGGMAAALALHRRGHDVEIFERFDRPRPLGAGLLLQPTGLAALRTLGLEDAVRAWGAEVTRLDGWTRQGGRVLDLPYRGEMGLGIHRAALFTALYDAVRADAITVHGGAPIRAIDGADRERADLVGEDGARREDYELVIVADGAHSRLRDNVSPRAQAPLYPWGAFWGILPDTDGRWAGALKQVYDGARVMIGVLPVGKAPNLDLGAAPVAPNGDDHVSFFWSVKTTDFAAARAQGFEALKAEVSDIWPEAGELLAQADSFDALSDASYRNVAARPWARGRLVIIGDAAHGMSPQLGQGANLALIDALELAHALGDADATKNASGDVGAALRAYARARSAHTAYYQFMSWMLTPIFQGDSRVIAWLRDRTMLTMCKAPVSSAIMHATLNGRGTFGFKAWRGAWERDADDETPAIEAPRDAA